MIVFPNCKINVGLRILRKRSDNYHDLETVFLPLPLYDVLEIIPSEEKEISFTSSGLIIDTPSQNNLCTKAYLLLQKDFPQLPAVHIHLHKTIPLGAGLGGGSADAAFTLSLLNRQFGLGLTETELAEYALQLGSDCPFFIINKPCYATGRGEELTPITIDTKAWKFIIVNPGIHVNTAEAFSILTPALPALSVKEIISQPVDTWKQDLINDFEIPVFKKHPQIETIKTTLYNAGALYASLSGSGSTVYGIFKKEEKPVFNFPENYFCKEVSHI